jgi:hypothetical protein
MFLNNVLVNLLLIALLVGGAILAISLLIWLFTKFLTVGIKPAKPPKGGTTGGTDPANPKKVRFYQKISLAWPAGVAICTLVVCVAFWGMFVEAWKVIVTSPSDDPLRGFISFCGLSALAGLVLLAVNKTAQKHAPHFVGSIAILLALALIVANHTAKPAVGSSVSTRPTEVRPVASSDHGPVVRTEVYTLTPGKVVRINVSGTGGVERWADRECAYSISSEYNELIRDFPGNKDVGPPARCLFYRTVDEKPVTLRVVYY